MNLLNSLSAASCCNVGAYFSRRVLKSHFCNSGKSSPRPHHQASEKVRPAVNIYLLIRDAGVELASFFLPTLLTEALVSTTHNFSFTSPAETRFSELGNTSSENAFMVFKLHEKEIISSHGLLCHLNLSCC